MDESKPRKSSMNFRDIFLRRRNSIDEVFSHENSRKNSLVNPESFKNLVSLMVVSKVTSNHIDP
jgi:hypothetical protein